MKSKLTIFGLFLIVAILQSCSFDTPENYFDRTTLNLNKYASFGAKDFDRMSESFKQDALFAEVDGEFVTQDKFHAHIKTFKLNGIQTDIETIEKLKKTEETEEMIQASLDIFNFIKSKYETDYLKIAKLMDENASEAAINEAVMEFEDVNIPIYNEKLDKLWDVALPYAKNNGIEVSFY